MSKKLYIIAFGAILSFANSAMAAPVSVNTTANATIVASNQVSALRTLEFGTIAKTTSSASTVRVPSAAGANVTPVYIGGNAYSPTGFQARAAQFRISGNAGQAYTVTTPTLTFANAANNLANVTALDAVSAAGALGTLPANGQDDLYVGGQFDVSASTTTQVYSGTLSLTVNFN